MYIFEGRVGKVLVGRGYRIGGRVGKVLVGTKSGVGGLSVGG